MLQLKSGQPGWRKDQASRTNSGSGETIHAANKMEEDTNDGKTWELQDSLPAFKVVGEVDWTRARCSDEC